MIDMARLTSKGRKRMKSKQFAIPGKRGYPINDLAHARNALARVAQHGSPKEKAKVYRAVSRRYPGLAKRSASIKRWKKRRR